MMGMNRSKATAAPIVDAAILNGDRAVRLDDTGAMPAAAPAIQGRTGTMS